MESENTQQVNGKGKSKQDYNAWTVEESRMLLQLMVDATSHGWRDANGMLSKATVETKLLPKINEKLSFSVTALGLGGIQPQRNSLLLKKFGKTTLSPTQKTQVFKQKLVRTMRICKL
ncbi:hypothetical protein L3X38_033088 [Prunus dulcis]|uniref:Uncharacterized protein n=1 Tax=Prunus dulcis TaxID=3755 RepID=A0AAD4VFA4_PRUDU|nr:hypothetical protein L3X38_033088 [Prunus dulcis]